MEYSVNTQFPAPFYIADRIRDGFNELHSITGYSQDKVWVFWDSLNTQYNYSYFGRYAINGIPIIYINSKGGTDDNWDEWDDCVILHEYSHFIIWEHGQESPHSFGHHDMHYPPRDTVISGIWNRIPDLAFNEAVAHFIGGVLRQSKYCEDSVYNTPTYTPDLERPLPDAPFVHPNDFGGPSQLLAYYNGAQVEWAIAAGLWDLYDYYNDGVFYIGSQVYGHNNDSNEFSSWRGFDYFWDILINYDPLPDNPDHTNCWNFYEFQDGWRKSGYPVDSTFVRIFNAHNLPIFIPGDANSDNSVNVGDAVYLINYVFKGGNAPDPLESGDSNCDNSVNVGDAIYVQEYVFKFDPVPIICPQYDL